MATTTPPARFDIGRVIQRTFGLIGRNWMVFFGLALLLSGVPQGLLAWANIEFAALAAATTEGGEASAASLAPMFTYLGVVLLGSLAALAGAYVLQAAVIHGSIADLNGERASFGQCAAAGFRKFFPLLGLAIVVGLACMLGFLLLIVPALILMTMWLVAAPALVVERRGVFDSMSRSAALTKGHRWLVFALTIIYIIVVYMITGALTGLGMALGLGFGAGLGDGTGAVQIGSTIATVPTSLIGAVGVASVYYELRMLEEGIGPEQLASVFD